MTSVLICYLCIKIGFLIGDGDFRSQTRCSKSGKLFDSDIWKWAHWHAEGLEWRVAVLSGVSTFYTSGEVYFDFYCLQYWCKVNTYKISDLRLLTTLLFFRILRDRALYKVTSDFVDAANSGAIGVINRCIPPINPTDPECFHMWVFLNKFFPCALLLSVVCILFICSSHCFFF